MIEDMTVRNLSPATQQSYVYAVAKFGRYFNRSPDRLGLEDVRVYQLYLIGQKRSWSHINQNVCALRFFFGVTMGRTDAFERIVAAREPQRLPVVLSGEEIVQFLEAVPGLRNRVALTTAYGAGMRVGEVVRLQTTSIDSSRMLIASSTAKAARTAMLGCRPNSCRYCAPIGDLRGRDDGCFRGVIQRNRSALPPCRNPAGKPHGRRN
jgi:site-specific recombinase XerD